MEKNVAAVLERLAKTPMLGFEVTGAGAGATATVKTGAKEGLKPVRRQQPSTR